MKKQITNYKFKKLRQKDRMGNVCFFKTGNEIKIKSNIPEDEFFQVLFHELIHVDLNNITINDSYEENRFIHYAHDTYKFGDYSFYEGNLKFACRNCDLDHIECEDCFVETEN